MSASIALAGLATVPNITVGESVDKSSLTSFERPVVDLKVEYPDAPSDIPCTPVCHQLPKSTTHNGKLMAASASLKSAQSHDFVLRTPFKHQGVDAGRGTTLDVHPVAASYDGILQSVLNSESPVGPIEYELTTGKQSVNLSVESTVMEVASSANEVITLAPRTFSVPEYGEPELREVQRGDTLIEKKVRPRIGSRKVEATPVLSLQNHGRMTVLDSNEGMVVPVSNEDLVSTLVGKREVVLNQVSGTDVAIVRNNGGRQK